MTVVITLALCIGANTAIFSVVDALMFRPLPYPHPERLGSVARWDRSTTEESQSPAIDGFTWFFLRDHVRSVDAAVRSEPTSSRFLPPIGAGRYVEHMRVSSGFFRVVGVPPALGRGFLPEEDRVGGPAVAVVSESLWREGLSADTAVLGRTVSLRGETCVIVGVMPAGFATRPPAEIWTPLRPSLDGEGAGDNYTTVVRVRLGYSRQQAAAELAAARPASFLRDEPPSGSTSQLRWQSVQRAAAGSLMAPLFLLWGAVGLVLVIGCVNVAGLMLARGNVRRQEIATRLALGSGRRRIVGQLLAESLLLAAGGCLGGLALARASIGGLQHLATGSLGLTERFTIDLRVLAMTVATTLLTSLIFGLYPALENTRADVWAVLVSAGRCVSSPRKTRARRALVIGQVALSALLLAAAGLVLRSLLHATSLDPGYDGRNVLTATLPMQDARLATSVDVNQLFEISLARIRQAPGVEAAGVGLGLPYERTLNDGARLIDGPRRMETAQTTNITYVTPGYFEALRFSLGDGRLFDDRDRAQSPPVAIVNQAYVRRYLRDDRPMGRHIHVAGAVREVVGVVGDVQQIRSFGEFDPIAPMPVIYVPAAQTSDRAFPLIHTWYSPKWVVRASGPRVELERAMREAVAVVDPRLPFARFGTMDEWRSAAFTIPRAEAVLLGALAGLALLLAAIGIYGLIAQSVTERTREFGIRLALGSSVPQVITVAAGPGIASTMAGVVMGCALARAGANVLRASLWGVEPNDALTLWSVSATLVVIALVASLVPCLRLARIDPAQALRDP